MNKWPSVKLWIKRLIFAGLIIHALSWVGGDETVKQGFGMVLLALYYLIYRGEA